MTSKLLTILPGLPVFRKVNASCCLRADHTCVRYTIFFPADLLGGMQFHGSDYSSGTLPFLMGLLGLTCSITLPDGWHIGLQPCLCCQLRLPFAANKTFLPRRHCADRRCNLRGVRDGERKVIPNHLLMTLFPIIIVRAGMSERFGIVLFCSFSVVTTIESSLCFDYSITNCRSSFARGLARTGSLNLYLGLRRSCC